MRPGTNLNFKSETLGTYSILQFLTQKFFSLHVKDLHFKKTVVLYRELSWISINLPHGLEYCCHVWTGAPLSYLDLLDKLQKRIYTTVGPSLAASLEPLAHRRNVASVSLFYRYYFGRCSFELAQMVPFPYSSRRFTHYSDRLHEFSVTIARCFKDVYVNSFFPRTARTWISLPIECFTPTYDLNSFKFRINSHLLTASSF